MSKYHKVVMDNIEYTMRDVPIDPFSKKIRIAPLQLKNKMLEKLEKKENIDFLRYINSRIHLFVDEEFLHLDDHEVTKYIEKNIYSLKNEIEIK